MANVACLTTKRYEKLAVEFVNAYVKDGEIAAGKLASKNLKEHEYDDFRPFVWSEFKRQGYEVIPYEELD